MSNSKKQEHSSPYHSRLLPAGGLDLGKYYSAARERLGIFLATSIAVGLAVLAFLATLEPLYKGETTIQLLRQGEKQLQFTEVTQENLENSEDLNTEVDFYESDQILERVATRIKSEILAEFVAPYDLDKGSVSLETIMNIVEENRNVVPSRMSLVVVIEYLHHDPVVAARIANFFHEEITAAHTDRRTETMQRAIQDLRGQAEIQRLKVENLEREIHAFKNQYKTLSFDQGLDIDRQEMLILNTNATNAKDVVDGLYAKWSMVERKLERKESLIQLSFLTDNPNTRELLATISRLKIEMAELTQRYREHHPKMIQAQESLQAAEAELTSSIATQVEMLRAELRQAERNYQASIAKVNQKKQEILDLQGMQGPFDSKMRDLDVNKKLYLQFFSRIQEIEAQKRGQTARIRIVDEARTPRELAQPNIKMGVMLAVAAGGMSGVFLVLLLILMDDKVKSQSDIESKLRLPILGLLGASNVPNKTLHESVMINAKDPRTSENLNSIVDSLRLDQDSPDSKVLLVTSTSHKEGKSYVAASLASAFERYGEKTILLGCDLRRTDLAGQMKVGCGLVPYLENEGKEIDQCIYRSPALECDIMPAGANNDHPYRLFDSERFKHMMVDLKGKYDRIILDTPPSYLYGDARNLAKHCDGLLYVVGFGIPRQDNALNAIEKLNSLGKPIFGAIVNGLTSRNANAYYPEFFNDQNSYLHSNSTGGRRRFSLRSILSRVRNRVSFFDATT